MELLNQVLELNSYIMKNFKNNQVSIWTANSDDYEKLIKALRINDANHYIFDGKNDKRYKVVIEGLYFKLDMEKLWYNLEKKVLYTLDNVVANVSRNSTSN